MTDLLPPPVPSLSDDWVARRRHHLVAELCVRPRRRRPLAATIGVGAAVGGAAAVVAVVAPGAPAAFARWNASPTAPAAGQVATAQAACQARLVPLTTAERGAASGWQPAVTDIRGPFTLSVFTAGTATATCLDDGSFESVSVRVGPQPPPPPAGGVVVDQASFTARQGEPFTLVVGRAGAGVTAVTLVRADGSTIETSLADGRFAAWWPGDGAVRGAEASTPTGVVTTPLHLQPLQRYGVMPGTGKGAGTPTAAGSSVGS
ncbi:MAG TPA: hypothetical protein VMV22_00185 [Acidimicrobiales bacterium]|nr:hypothetical protein [Acidimicrobiales bacterium]